MAALPKHPTGQSPAKRHLWILVSCCWLMVLFPAGSVLCAEPTGPNISQSPPPQLASAPVIFEEETLFFLYDKVGSFTRQERAKAIEGRLVRLSQDPQTPLDEISIDDVGEGTIIAAGDMIIMMVTDGDVKPLGQTRQAIAKDYAKKIQVAVTKSREQVSLRTFIINAALALLDTVIFLVLLVLFHKTFPKIYSKLEAWRGTAIRAIKIQRVELLSADQIVTALIGLARTIRIAAVLVLMYVYLTTVLGIFPWTKGISASLFGAVLSTLRAIGQAFSTYIPNVISIVIIIFFTRYFIKLISLFFTGISRGAITFAGFHREWAEPTYKIVRFLVIVFAAIACFPYIPGSQSEGFRGISVFLGLLISFGSAAAIGNVTAGVVLTYMRPFDIGDRVKIAETVGDVIQRELLVTRIRTIKNVDITVPNSLVLGSHIINYSACARDRGLILHTSVTIGYDAPWKQVHELLIAAARATTHILAKPDPFVLQTSLDDFYVTYEINASTDQPNEMATIYAELHQNIQDKFNEAGVEIMSPHYGQIRDGNQTTIPEQYLPKTYQAPAFRIGALGNLFGGSKDPGNAKGEPRP